LTERSALLFARFTNDLGWLQRVELRPSTIKFLAFRLDGR
jgi:hypothetical protein